jgi:AraC-like DNA-binding protein
MGIITTPSSKSVLLKYLVVAAANNFNNVLFMHDKPIPDYPVYLGYLGRVIVTLEGSLNLIGVYENEIECRQVTTKDIIYTAENCWVKSDHRSLKAKSISVIIMPNYIRFVASEHANGSPHFNPYYHINSPPSELLLTLTHALNTLKLNTSNESKEKAVFLIKAFLLEAIDELKKDQVKELGKSEKTFKLIKEYIDCNYHMQIDLNQICNEIGYNPCYISRIFKKYANENFKSYIENRRMIAAKEALCSMQIKVGQVAMQCGYSSEAYFIKVFKKLYGITPGEFRNKRLP